MVKWSQNPFENYKKHQIKSFFMETLSVKILVSGNLLVLWHFTKKRNAYLESSYKDISTWEGHIVTVKMPTYVMVKNGKKQKKNKIDKSYWLEDVFCNIGFCPLTKMFEFFFLLMSSNLRSIACRNYLFEVKRGWRPTPYHEDYYAK